MKLATAHKITWLHAADDLAKKAGCTVGDRIAAEVVAGIRQEERGSNASDEIIVTCEDLRRAVRTRAEEKS